MRDAPMPVDRELAQSAVIGLISDTHGVLRQEAVEALRGVDVIIHGGDVGSRDILVELATIAPVHAVYGNTDDPFTPGLHEAVRLDLAERRVVATHGHLIRRLTPDALLERFDEDLVVYGHTHKPLVHRAGARVVVNPGAAGPRRFNLRPSVARVTLTPGGMDVEIVEL
jgi:uncharacterized protein